MQRLGRFLLHPRVRAVIAWLVLLGAAAPSFYYAWVGYNDAKRPDGNFGHVLIDFSGQWLMGRMLARGEGHYLYNRPRLYEALQAAYPDKDADQVHDWLIESEDHPDVGGPLYPPVHAFLFYPLGLLPPQPAYRLMQIVNFSLTFVIGFLAWKLTHGRVWPAVAAAVVMAFPGYAGAVCLGQNALLTLALLLLGWLLTARGRPWLGGFVWGLLAFKPVWAASFFAVPLLMRRWRMCVAMLLTGAALALLTLPFVGVQTWLDWLTVGREATLHYARDETWIFLSRDLQNIPTRYMLQYADEVVSSPEPERALPARIGLALLLAVAALTGAVALWRWRRPAGTEGIPAAFLMLGAYLCCFHFMYYDALIALLPVCLLFTDPRRYLIPATVRPPGPRGGWLWNPFPPTLLVVLLVMAHFAEAIDWYVSWGHPAYHTPPYDTFCLMALWAWCGWRWLREADPDAVGTPALPA